MIRIRKIPQHCAQQHNLFTIPQAATRSEIGLNAHAALYGQVNHYGVGIE